MQKLLVRTVEGVVVDVPKFPETLPTIPIWNTWDDFKEIIADLAIWDNSRLTYLASADNWLGLEWFFDREEVKPCDIFYSVIGGLGGLNFIHLLKETKKIIFYDVNQYAVRILDLYLQLIEHCKSVNEFISLIYQRPFKSKPLDEFFSIPLDSEYEKTLKDFLTAEAYETYKYFYIPCISSQIALESRTVHCNQLRLNWDASDKTKTMVMPLKDENDNINSFFVGKGWLENDETFLATRQKLLEVEIEVLIGGILNIEVEGEYPGNYMSNIFNTDPQDSGYIKVINKYAWMIGFDDRDNFIVKYYQKE